MTSSTDTIQLQHIMPSTIEVSTASEEYWVTRVVRQMAGCSPSKIDSVIQANLPPRKIKWSQRPDTLEIPGLKGRVAYSIDNLPKCYELGYFKDNPLIHPEVSVKPIGIESNVLENYSGKNEGVITLLIACLVILLIIIRHCWAFITYQYNGFTNYLKKNHTTSSLPPQIGFASSLSINILICLIGAILFMGYAKNNYDLTFCPITNSQLLLIYAGCLAIYFIIKNLTSSFINWIFFDKTSRHAWKDSYSFLLICKTTFLLAIAETSIFAELTPQMNVMLTCVVVISFKLGVLYKTYSIFLPKIYCILHLLSYLCALEIIPLTILWVAMTGITDRLSLIY
ncbi:MAG: DUF4271 domain-containing protein [Bacteroidaceae bacterium]|nr:DUF4271 domain-containing protein [Bacteroidaceae bacterium]